MMSQAISKNSLILTGFALIVAAGLAITDIATRELRAESIRKVRSQALEAIIPTNEHDNNLLDDIIPVNDSTLLKLKVEKTIHIARKAGKVIAFIIPTRTANGYGGAIESIVGIYLDGSIAGVRVIKHQETPGLGDKVELKKSPWILSFNGQSLNNLLPNEWAVKKDKGVFDQFTGATITPRATVQSVYHALLYFQQHKALLLAQANDSNNNTMNNTAGEK